MKVESALSARLVSEHPQTLGRLLQPLLRLRGRIHCNCSQMAAKVV